MLQNLDTCIGAFYCDATGYDAIAKKLVDKSGYGNDLALKVGTAPVYATRSGVQVMDFDTTYYFEGENLWKSGGSCIVVGVLNATPADGVLYLVNTLSRFAAAGNFDGVPNDAVDADWFASTFGRKCIQFNGNTPRAFEPSTGAVASGSNFVAGTINLFTSAVSLHPAQMQGATRATAVVTSSISQEALAAKDGSVMRIGHLKAAGGLTATFYVSVKRVYFFTGNVFEHANFVTERANEIALWGI